VGSDPLDPSWNTIPVAFFRAGDVHITNRVVGDFAGWSSVAGVVRAAARITNDGRSDIVLTGGLGWKTIPVAASNGDGSFNVTNHPAGDAVNTWGDWAAEAPTKLFGPVR
jgi:hypothetical protein